MTNIELFKTTGNTPVVTNSSNNNGISGFVDLKPTEKGGIITYSDTTTSDAIFYQPDDFIGYSHIQGLYPYDKENWSEKSLLFFVSLFRKSAANRFNYTNKFNRNIAKELLVSLPVNKNGKIDFNFMKLYIRELEQERILELKKERIQELTAYLKVSDLENYNLTTQELRAINLINNNEIKFKDYKINELFKLSSSKKKFNANSIQFGGKYPYVVRTSQNNGIRDYLDEDEKFLNPAKTISFGQDTATIFYQEKPYFTGDKIKILKFLPQDLNTELACFLLSTMNKAFKSFQWGQSSFNEDILNNTKIKLPVKPNDEIDYLFMKTYIKAIEKLVIKRVILWKDKVISKTEKVVNS